MSYDILQKNIDQKLKRYKQKVGKDYYTYYYYEALDLLDKYILDLANGQRTKSQVKISELLSKANKIASECRKRNEMAEVKWVRENERNKIREKQIQALNDAHSVKER